MKKAQIILEYFILGTVVFIIMLSIFFKASGQILCYTETEHNLKKSTILSQIKYISAPVLLKSRSGHPEEDKILITTEYFSYYIPANDLKMSDYCGKSCVQKAYLSSIAQIFHQLKVHKVKYDLENYKNFKKFINEYINSPQNLKSVREENIKTGLKEIKADLSQAKSPIADECYSLLEKLVSSICN